MSHRALFAVSGVVLIIGGVLAVFLPFAATLAAVLIVGWTLILAGVLHIVEAFRNAEDRMWNAGFGIVGLLLGASFVINPFAGMLSLTIVLGVLFGSAGSMQLYMAYKRRKTDSVWPLAVSGVLSIGLAILIAMNLFTAAVTVPGILLAIELISTGVGLLLLKPHAAKSVSSVATGDDNAATLPSNSATLAENTTLPARDAAVSGTTQASTPSHPAGTAPPPGRTV